MRILPLGLLLLLISACDDQPHHRPLDAALQTRLAAAITAVLPQLPEAPPPGDWITDQAAMLALAAEHDRKHIDAIAAGNIATAAVRRQSGWVLARLRDHPQRLRPPRLLRHLHEVDRPLNSDEQLLLYSLSLQTMQEAQLEAPEAALGD